MMDNRMINRYLKSYGEIRADWVERLVSNHGSTTAATKIIEINAAMSLLRTMWNWNDETVEMEYPL